MHPPLLTADDLLLQEAHIPLYLVRPHDWHWIARAEVDLLPEGEARSAKAAEARRYRGCAELVDAVEAGASESSRRCFAARQALLSASKGLAALRDVLPPELIDRFDAIAADVRAAEEQIAPVARLVDRTPLAATLDAESSATELSQVNNEESFCCE